MKVSITKRIELTNEEYKILQQAAEILATLARELDDSSYDDIADDVKNVYMQEIWEEIAEEDC